MSSQRVMMIFLPKSLIRMRPNPMIGMMKVRTLYIPHFSSRYYNLIHISNPYTYRIISLSPSFQSQDDGEWEPPMIDNPDYKGPWKPKMIDNPDYKGPWEHPMIPNPEYIYDSEMYAVCKEECTHVGFELWQVKSGTIFDDIIVTDSLEEAQQFAEETFFKKKDKEKELFDDAKKKKEEEEKAAREAEMEDMEDEEE